VLTVTTVALHTLTPITELSEVIPGAPKRRSAPGQEVFDPHNEFTFHYAKSGRYPTVKNTSWFT
jgi:hypothetical protein